MKAVVTGSSGFIGGHLKEALIRRGFEVRCLLRHGTYAHTVKSPPVKKYYINYQDLSSLLETEAFRGIDYIFHLAGVTKAVTLKSFKAGNLIPTANLLKALQLKKINLKRFLLLSSTAAVGPAPSLHLPVDASIKPRPVEFYGLSKLSAERELKQYAPSIPFTIIRSAPVYGPGDKDFLNFFKQVNAGLHLFCVKKSDLFSIIFVKDLVEGILKAVSTDTTVGRTYLLSNDLPICWEELYDIITGLMNRTIWMKLNIPWTVLEYLGCLGDAYSILSRKKILINTQKIKLAKAKFWICSNKQAKSDFEFKPSYSIKQGLEETLQWYRQHRWL